MTTFMMEIPLYFHDGNSIHFHDGNDPVLAPEFWLLRIDGRPLDFFRNNMGLEVRWCAGRRRGSPRGKARGSCMRAASGNESAARTRVSRWRSGQEIEEPPVRIDRSHAKERI
jgi:hypothetical protein